MKKRLFAIPFILFFFLPLTLLAQNSGKIWIEVNSGFTYMGLDRGLFDSWNSSWNVGTGVTYRFNPNLELGTRISYHHLATTKPTNMYEASFAFRLIVPSPYIRPYFSMGSGAYFINTIRETGYPYPVPALVDELPSLSQTRKKYLKGFLAIGLGLEVPLNNKMQLRLEGQYTNIYDGSGSFIPLTAAFQVAL